LCGSESDRVSLFQTNHTKESACRKMKNEDGSPMTTVGDDGGGKEDGFLPTTAGMTEKMDPR